MRKYVIPYIKNIPVVHTRDARDNNKRFIRRNHITIHTYHTIISRLALVMKRHLEENGSVDLPEPFGSITVVKNPVTDVAYSKYIPRRFYKDGKAVEDKIFYYKVRLNYNVEKDLRDKYEKGLFDAVNYYDNEIY